MVYCGKPSKSCDNCRLIKRRCDQNVPSCGPCLRMGQICRGYRDPSSLSFRNETAHVIKRALAKRGKQSSVKELPCSSPKPTKTAKTTDTTTPLVEDSKTSMLTSIQPTAEELGAGYFLSSIIAASKKITWGYLEFISEIYVSDDFNEIILDGVSAVGLAALANISHHPAWTINARKKYVETVQRINAALSSPTEALRDGILLTIIVLGLFELVAGGSAFSRHIYGAAALIELRGPAQFRSRACFRMFSHVTADLMFVSLKERKAIPRHMILLRAHAAKYVDPTNFVWRSSSICLRSFDFLGRYGPDPTLSLSQLVTEALDIDHAFRGLFDLLSIPGRYLTVFDPNSDPQLTYKHRYDLYDDSWIIRIWNGARCFRILVHEMVRERILSVSHSDDSMSIQLADQLRHSTSIISQMREEVLASVPQALGYISVGSHQSTVNPLPQFWSRVQPLKSRPFTPISGSNLNYWFLYLSGKTSGIEDDERAWVISHLRRIGNERGISTALNLALDLGIKKPSIFSL